MLVKITRSPFEHSRCFLLWASFTHFFYALVLLSNIHTQSDESDEYIGRTQASASCPRILGVEEPPNWLQSLPTWLPSGKKCFCNDFGETSLYSPAKIKCLLNQFSCMGPAISCYKSQGDCAGICVNNSMTEGDLSHNTVGLYNISVCNEWAQWSLMWTDHSTNVQFSVMKLVV